MAIESAVMEQAGDNAPSPAENQDEGAAPESLSDAELAEALKQPAESDTPEPQAEGVEEPEKEQAPEPTDTAPVSKEEFDKLKKKMENQELFIQRQGTEVGQLRKLKEKLVAAAKEKRELAEEQLLVNPTQAMDTHADAREVERQIRQVEQSEQLEANRDAIHAAFPDYESRIEDIAITSLEMGIPPELVENYRKNPYGTNVNTLIPYVRAAALRKHYFTQASLAQKLKEQLTDLSTNTGGVSKKLKEAARQQPAIKSAGGSHLGGIDAIDEGDITNLSYAEIERLLKVK